MNTISYQKNWQSSFSIIEFNTDKMISFFVSLLNKYGDLRWSFNEAKELLNQIKSDYNNNQFYISNIDIFLDKLKDDKYLAPFKTSDKNKNIDDELHFDYIDIIDD